MAKFITQISNTIEQFFLSRSKNNNLLNEYYKRKDKGGASYKRQAIQLQKQEVKDMTNAIMAATDPDNPRRGDLMRFYQSLNNDLHLCSCVDNRILPVQCAKYNLVDKDGTPDEAAKKLLEKPWFLELIRLVIKSTFEGTTLIELFKLNERMEVAELSEIPQSNFLAHKGIVVAEEYDEKGTCYKEGAYKNYYIQIGNDWNLGLYVQIGLIIIAKKLGLGSWLSYIDKFGVPPIFAITDRMDDGRLDELFEMLQQFRQNHFAVLQGNEKIEVPNHYNVDAYNSFLALNKYADELISKRLLGGTGTTDEKSFVGAAEIHERIFQYRNKVDKLLFKFYFNEEIKPRLVKLSEVYKPLENLTFEFDDTETLTLKEKMEMVKTLSTHYEFDVEELAKITGLPIIKVKELTDTTVSNENQEDNSQKKNPDATVSGTELMAHVQLFAATWDAAIERLANDIYEDKVKSTDLDKDLVLKNYAAFNTEAEKAWGKGYYDTDNATTRRFRENLLKFAGAKSHDLMKHIESEKDSFPSKEDFIENAKKKVNIHNDTYLTTELRFCNSAVHSAQDYKQYLAEKDTYPNLKYRNFNDETSRDNHAINDGIIKPVEAWKALPPYDHNCRCWLEQTDEVPTGGKLQGVKFKNNPTKSGKLFDDSHSYFENVDAKAKGKVKDNTELMKTHTPYNKTIKAGDKTVFVNDFYDIADGAQNIAAAKLVAEKLEQDVYILPHINNSDKMSAKNPELGISKNSYLADLKTFNPTKQKSTRNFIANSIKSANKQGCKAVVFDLSKAPETNSLELAAQKLRGELKGNGKANIKQVVIIKDEDVIKVKRNQFTQEDYLKHFVLD